MAAEGVKLFLSCVSDEFGSYRDGLRKALTLPNVEVKIQEDFKGSGGDTLRTLADYVESCETVVHFFGDMNGSTPEPSNVDDLLLRHPELESRLATKGLGRDALKTLTYTQWEAWLAIGFDRDLVIVAPADVVPHSQGYAPTAATRASQAEHVKRLRAINRYPEKEPFTSADNLIAQVFLSAVRKALIKAGAVPVRQPRNLPFASLGALFKGRNAALNELRAALMSGKGAAVTGRALHGLGGIGKTRLAIEYAWAREAEYSALLFLRADDPATMNAGLAALTSAEVLDLPEKEAREDADKIEVAVRWLETHPTWLMILDNVDDNEAVRAVAELMARLKGGHLIITARATNFPASIRKLSLDALEEDAAAEFLLERTRDDRAPAADDTDRSHELAHELGGLALGLEQAGAYVARLRIGFQRYLKLWREKRESVLKWFDKSLMSYDHDVGLAATWAASVEQLTPESRRLLDRLAFLAPDPIPDSLLDAPVPGEAAGYDAYEARAGLFAYSLANQAKGEDGAAMGFVVHRLVQDFARRAMMDERRGDALREALGWIDAAFVGEPQDVRSWPVLDPLAPHALAVARRADEGEIASPTGRLFNQIAVLCKEKARYAEAEPLFRRVVEISQEVRGRDDPIVATCLNNLAELLRQTNRSAEAEPLVRRALAIDEASYGLEHSEVATDLSNLALVLQATNRQAEAEPLMRRALAILEASYGPNHPKVAISLSVLAVLLQTTNRPVEAEPLIRRALAIDEASLGPDDPKVAIRLHNLAALLCQTNRLVGAEPLMRRALAILEKSLGPDHPNAVTTRKSLTTLLAALSKRA